MKRVSRMIFICVVVCVIATGLLTSVAQAEPFWCHWYCGLYGNGCELWVSCTCPGQPAVSTTCYGWCDGYCEQ